MLTAGAAVSIWIWRGSAGPIAQPAPASGPVAESAPVRPSAPPDPSQPRVPIREPKSPELTPEWKAALTERVRGQVHPGEAAFTAYADRFVDENLEFAQAQANAEGITVPEVRALTRLGLLVMATQRIPDVEEVLGRELSPETKDALEQMVQRENGSFKEQMRALVAKGASEAKRWDLISAADARYREQLDKISGLTPELLDDLLAGNLLLPGAPTGAEAGALGSDSSAPGRKDTVIAPPRPAAQPR